MNKKKQMRAQVYIVIPAFEPDRQLVKLVRELREFNEYQLIIVDDGSGIEYESIFSELGTNLILLRHEQNQGKGAALKTAFQYINAIKEQEGIVVTVDADGQHTIEDVQKVIHHSLTHPDVLTLGIRTFRRQDPLRFLLSSHVARTFFRIVTNKKLRDVQCGLRAFHTELIPWMLKIEGRKFEYEMNVLIQSAREKLNLDEVEIQNFYPDRSSNSHYRMVIDTIRSFSSILKFNLSSFFCFLVDYTMFSLFADLFGYFVPAIAIPAANVSARIISASLNFYINRKYVFHNEGDIGKAAIQYFMLSASILAGNTFILSAMLSTLHMKRWIAKTLTELICFVVNWVVQQHFIFKQPKFAEVE